MESLTENFKNSVIEKWKYYLNLRRFLVYSFVVDARLHPQYERGWNDAVAHISANAENIYRGDSPITVKQLLEDETKT